MNFELPQFRLSILKVANFYSTVQVLHRISKKLPLKQLAHVLFVVLNSVIVELYTSLNHKMSPRGVHQAQICQFLRVKDVVIKAEILALLPWYSVVSHVTRLISRPSQIPPLHLIFPRAFCCHIKVLPENALGPKRDNDELGGWGNG